MPTVRITLFDRDYNVLDTADVVLSEDPGRGPGAAVEAAKAHFWQNHFSIDLEPLLSSRENLLTNFDALLKAVEDMKANFLPDLISKITKLDLTQFKAAVMEGKMISDMALPKKYLKEMEEKFSRRVKK